MRNLAISLAILAAFVPAVTIAHGGGLDASGCHNNNKRGGYHCHRGGVPTMPFLTPVVKLPVPEPPQDVVVSADLTQIKQNEFSVEVQPTKEPVWVNGRWNVYSYDDEDSCEIGIVPKEGEYLTVKYAPRETAVYLVMTNKDATSKVDGEIVILDVMFFNEKVLTGSWRNINFKVTVMADGRRAIASEALAKNFLSLFSSEIYVAVITKSGEMFGGINLDGSSLATSHLRKCAYAAADLNPNDPFLDGL